ncbi:MAG TPA: hypothetical protein VM756_15970 [Burkholderiales bacterium]|nr:hypothetical protein [Burkholderiales bacterium]
MANWDKHKPKGLTREELHKRVSAGLEAWKARGWIPQDFGKNAGAIAAADGPTLNRKDRKRVMQAADIAITALASHARQDYVHAVKVINATRRLAGLPTRFMQTICDGIADAAAAASGEPREFLDKTARTWLNADINGAERRIFLPSKGANDDGKEDREAGSAGETESEAGTGGPGDQALQAPGEDDQPQLQPGEGGDGTGGAGGSVAADDPDDGGPGSVPRDAD